MATVLDWMRTYNPVNRTRNPLSNWENTNLSSVLEWALQQDDPWASGILPALMSNLGLSRDLRLLANQQGLLYGYNAMRMADLQSKASQGVIDESSPYFTGGTNVTSSGIGDSKTWEPIFQAYYQSGMTVPFSEFLDAWNAGGQTIYQQNLEEQRKRRPDIFWGRGDSYTSGGGSGGGGGGGGSSNGPRTETPFAVQSNIGDYYGDTTGIGNSTIQKRASGNNYATSDSYPGLGGTRYRPWGGLDRSGNSTARQQANIQPYSVQNSGQVQGTNQVNLGLGDAAYNLGQSFGYYRPWGGA